MNKNEKLSKKSKNQKLIYGLLIAVISLFSLTVTYLLISYLVNRLA